MQRGFRPWGTTALLAAVLVDALLHGQAASAQSDGRGVLSRRFVLPRPAGVVTGLTVVGSAGDEQITISPGYALDGYGREIRLSEPWVQQIPNVTGRRSGGSIFYTLTISRRIAGPDGNCTATAVWPRAAVFCWLRLNNVDRQPANVALRARIDKDLLIPLARIEILNHRLIVTTARPRHD
jgi:hypothetical protein